MVSVHSGNPVSGSACLVIIEHPRILMCFGYVCHGMILDIAALLIINSRYKHRVFPPELVIQAPGIFSEHFSFRP